MEASAATPGLSCVWSNGRATFTVNDLTRGTYRFWSVEMAGFGNHASIGMAGTLTVTP